jgi:hypothetical protein
MSRHFLYRAETESCGCLRSTAREATPCESRCIVAEASRSGVGRGSGSTRSSSLLPAPRDRRSRGNRHPRATLAHFARLGRRARRAGLLADRGRRLLRPGSLIMLNDGLRDKGTAAGLGCGRGDDGDDLGRRGCPVQRPQAWTPADSSATRTNFRGRLSAAPSVANAFERRRAPEALLDRRVETERHAAAGDRVGRVSLDHRQWRHRPRHDASCGGDGALPIVASSSACPRDQRSFNGRACIVVSAEASPDTRSRCTGWTPASTAGSIAYGQDQRERHGSFPDGEVRSARRPAHPAAGRRRHRDRGVGAGASPGPTLGEGAISVEKFQTTEGSWSACAP